MYKVQDTFVMIYSSKFSLKLYSLVNTCTPNLSQQKLTNKQMNKNKTKKAKKKRKTQAKNKNKKITQYLLGEMPCIALLMLDCATCPVISMHNKRPPAWVFRPIVSRMCDVSATVPCGTPMIPKRSVCVCIMDFSMRSCMFSLGGLSG